MKCSPVWTWTFKYLKSCSPHCAPLHSVMLHHMYQSDIFSFLLFPPWQNEDEDGAAGGSRMKPTLVSIPNPLYSGSRAFSEPFGVSPQKLIKLWTHPESKLVILSVVCFLFLVIKWSAERRPHRSQPLCGTIKVKSEQSHKTRPQSLNTPRGSIWEQPEIFTAIDQNYMDRPPHTVCVSDLIIFSLLPTGRGSGVGVGRTWRTSKDSGLRPV